MQFFYLWAVLSTELLLFPNMVFSPCLKCHITQHAACFVGLFILWTKSESSSSTSFKNLLLNSISWWDNIMFSEFAFLGKHPKNGLILRKNAINLNLIHIAVLVFYELLVLNKNCFGIIILLEVVIKCIYPSSWYIYLLCPQIKIKWKLISHSKWC